ncbi:unnamed protein product [Jaminaea pallidilutea]
MSQQENNQSAAASSSVVGSASEVASSATQYVSSTAQSVWDNAPDLGVSSRLTVNSSGSGQGHSGSGDGQAGDGKGSTNNADSSSSGRNAAEAKDGAEALRVEHEERVEQTKQSGPSNQSRLNKHQSSIGIEDSVPTSAGLASTQPVDDKAMQSARAGAERKEAKVPQDYEPVDCPSVHGGGTKGSGNQGLPKPSDRAAGGQGAGEDGNHQGSGGGDGSKEGGDDGRKLSQKLKDKVKGEAKVISGSVRHNEEKVNAGKALKRGDGAA